MTLPRGYQPPKKKEISESKDLTDNNDNRINKNENNLTNETLQKTTVDDSINEVIETGKEVIVGDFSTMDESIRHEDQSDKSQLTQENKEGVNVEAESELTVPLKNREEKNTNINSNSNLKEETEKLLDQQKQQIDNTISDVSHATNNFNDINEYQKTSNEIIEKSIDIASKYQQNAINTFQSITNNFVELQKNLLETYQSVISRFLDVTTKSYGNNSTSSQRYADIYNKTNQTITDNTINATNRINDAVIGSTETFNKSIEIAQKYYNDSIQNYFNFLKKIERSSSNQ